MAIAWEFLKANWKWFALAGVVIALALFINSYIQRGNRIDTLIASNAVTLGKLKTANDTVTKCNAVIESSSVAAALDYGGLSKMCSTDSGTAFDRGVAVGRATCPGAGPVPSGVQYTRPGAYVPGRAGIPSGNHSPVGK